MLPHWQIYIHTHIWWHCNIFRTDNLECNIEKVLFGNITVGIQYIILISIEFVNIFSNNYGINYSSQILLIINAFKNQIMFVTKIWQ